MAAGWRDVCAVVLAIILPPLGVLLETGLSLDLCINILLTLLGYIPGTSYPLTKSQDSSHTVVGIIHALYIVVYR